MKTISSQPEDTCTTVEAARLLGLAVRSVQLMVDRGELDGWKTPGGHRRIARDSVERVLNTRGRHGTRTPPNTAPSPAPRVPLARVLLIEDSVHYQNLVSLLVRREFPQVDLEIASDGITGLTLFGKFAPDVLLVDILLPGIDGAVLVTSLRTSSHFRDTHLIVVTSLDEAQREPFAYALQDLPVVHKSRLVAELPPLLARCLERDAAQP